MAQRTQLVFELKRALRERGITYATVAKKLGLSVASVKRLFSTGDFSLQRVDDICELLNMDMSQLLEKAAERALPTNRLSLAQEQEIVSDPKLFLVTWLVLTRTRFDEVLKRYRFTDRELQRYLIKLDRLKIIELQPMNKVRLLVNRQFSWRPGGPVQRYVHQKLLKEFVADHFTNTHDEFIFHGGTISESALSKLKRTLQRAAQEGIEIMEGDPSPETIRQGAAFVIALRPWNYSGFTQFLRE